MIDSSAETQDQDNAETPVETSFNHQPGKKQKMSIMEHLDELRKRIISSLISLIIGVLIAFFCSRYLIDFLKLLAPDTVTFVQLSPGEVLMTSFKLSVFVGAALASPIILYHLLRFILPGLKPKEQGFISLSVFFGSLLFLVGISFAYYAVIPPALGFLLDYGNDVAQNLMSIALFIDFCSSLIVLTGFMFELPVLLFLLSFTGLIHSKQLISHWRGAIVGIFLFSAVLTPSQDPFTMLIVASALISLYVASIIPIKLCGR